MTPSTTEMDKLPELDYQSFLAQAMRDYLDYLDHLGFAIVWRAYALRRLDRFLVDQAIKDFQQFNPRWVMTQLLDHYQGRVKAQTLRLWRQAFEGLCRYLVRCGGMRENLLADFPRLRLQPYRPYVFSARELGQFFDYLKQQAAQAPDPLAGYRAQSRYTLYHLLYAGGLRVSEALRLETIDYSPQPRTLYIRPSKFHKDRLIPIGAKASSNLDHLLALRRGLGGELAQGRLFSKLPPSDPYRRGWVSAYFRQVLQRLGLYRPEHTHQGCTQGTPHLHELRRAFAVHRLLKWYQQQVDIDAKLPLLATYMGHGYFGHTKTYLTLTQQLLAQAGQRFAGRFDRLDWVCDDPQLR
jgi:integrase/recombinase XerD